MMFGAVGDGRGPAAVGKAAAADSVGAAPSRPPPAELFRSLPWRDRAALGIQRAVGWLLAPVWVPVVVVVMRWGMGWRVEGVAAARRVYREVWAAGEGPIVVCANHLTLVDS